MSRRAVGVDIGGTKIAVGAVDEGERGLVAREETPTRPEQGFEQGVATILAAIDRVLGEAGWRAEDLGGIGIGCAGPLDITRGTVENDYTLPGWGGRDIVTPLRQRYGVSVWLENDGDAAVVGEAHSGAARGCDDVVMLTFGTGIGGGVLLAGEIHRGHGGQHPELGHIPVEVDGPACYCGRRGCFESVASGTALGASGLGSAREVFAARTAGDPAATAVVDRALRGAATAAWTLAHTFVPERIVLGGGLIEEHFEIFSSAMQQALVPATQLRPGLAIVRAHHGAAAGLIGAARIAIARPVAH